MSAELVVIGALVSSAALYAGWKLWRSLTGRGCCSDGAGEGSPCDGCPGGCGNRSSAGCDKFKQINK